MPITTSVFGELMRIARYDEKGTMYVNFMDYLIHSPVDNLKIEKSTDTTQSYWLMTFYSVPKLREIPVLNVIKWHLEPFSQDEVVATEQHGTIHFWPSPQARIHLLISNL